MGWEKLLALVRYFMELQIEFMLDLAKHQWTHGNLPPNWQRKLGLMRGIASLLPSYEGIVVTPIHPWRCEACGTEFEFAVKRDGDDACPHCKSPRIDKTAA